MRTLLVVVFVLLTTAGVHAQQADVTIAKSASPALPAAGDDITYSIQVTNIGGDFAPNVRVTDFVPANTTFQTAFLNGGGTAGGCAPPSVTQSGAVECTLNNLSPGGGTRTFTVVVRVNPDAAGATITNTATVTTTASESNTNNNSSTVQTQVSSAPPSAADLSVSKSRDAPLPYVGRGEVTTFTIVVRNDGPLAAQNVTLTDVLPAQTTFESLTAAAGFTCTTPAVGANGTVTCTAPSLANQATATFTLALRLTASASGTITNTATVSSTTPDPDSADRTSSATATATNPGPDLRIVKTASPPVVDPGSSITYTVEATNIGSQIAPSVRVTDFVPANTTFQNAFLVGGGSAGSCHPPTVTQSGAVECTLTGLSPQSGRTFTIVVRANPDAAGATITNTATVTSTSTDPDPSNNSSTVQTNVSGNTPTATDLSVSKGIPPSAIAFVGPNETATYVITLRNHGPLAAQNVVLTDAIPAQTTFHSLTAPAGFTCTTPAVGATGTVTCSNPSFADQANVTFTLTVRANGNASGTITNTATVTASTPDSNTANNSSSTTLTVTQSTGADLRLTKSANPTATSRGQTITYTITATNIGSRISSPVTIDDPVPAGTTFVSVVEPPGTALNCYPPIADNVVRCTSGSLFPGDSFTMTFTVRVNDDAGGTITNTATVTAGANDPNTSNNSATAQTQVFGAGPATADLSVAKDADGFVGAGEVQSYTIIVRNGGPSDAQSVTLTDAIPSQTNFQSLFAPPQFTCTTPAVGATGTVTCTTPTVAAQATAAFTLNVRANHNAAGTITNTAGVSSTTTDPDSTNNSSTVMVTVTQSGGADLRLTKTADPTTASPGQTITYTVTAANIGSEFATGVVIDDPVPAGTTFVSVDEPPGTAANCFDSAANNNVVRCTINVLGPGDAFTITFVARVNDDATGTITNTATVSSALTDPVPTNNSDTARTAVVRCRPHRSRPLMGGVEPPCHPEPRKRRRP